MCGSVWGAHVELCAYTCTVSTRRTSLVDPAPNPHCIAVWTPGGGGYIWHRSPLTSFGESTHVYIYCTTVNCLSSGVTCQCRMSSGGYGGCSLTLVSHAHRHTPTPCTHILTRPHSPVCVPVLLHHAPCYHCQPGWDSGLLCQCHQQHWPSCECVSVWVYGCVICECVSVLVCGCMGVWFVSVWVAEILNWASMNPYWGVGGCIRVCGVLSGPAPPP